MIIDKIKFKPGYAKDDSKTFASAGVEAEGLAPERIWRNMTNISNWNRYYPSITDIDFDNPSDTDPHISTRHNSISNSRTATRRAARSSVSLIPRMTAWVASPCRELSSTPTVNRSTRWCSNLW